MYPWKLLQLSQLPANGMQVACCQCNIAVWSHSAHGVQLLLDMALWMSSGTHQTSQYSSISASSLTNNHKNFSGGGRMKFHVGPDIDRDFGRGEDHGLSAAFARP